MLCIIGTMRVNEKYVSFFSTCIAMMLAVMLVSCENDDEPAVYNATPNVAGMSISPAQATLNFGETYIVFTASGGTPPYSWSVSDQSMGTITNVPFATITYTRTTSANGANIIRVNDSNQWTAEAIIIQTASTNNVSS